MRHSALVCCIALLFAGVSAAHEAGSNRNPLSFGDDQTIVDLDKIVWGPLEVEGLAPGAEIATIRGDLGKDHSESIVRLPPGYVLRSHTHTSDELYLWISGSFTLIAHDGTETMVRGPAYISYPGNAPPHGIRCGNEEPCLFYLRYSRPFDIKY
jgi:quercetin dioxygenase-like cupin family protein